ncbi:hypothetical protein PTSG_06453 [Salpingoeca rosetta]|uniref:Transcription factor CBF/NF-Y/archaeal histone domain-containing protein n=1 Tax=Salpingoeca rosetta (strain ATCC 50818 / BSB-021) TaxID=946362 RepID=F2UFU8_SALR5|nr:uncharacterized protein PTSG_06453 [Salpingoeca rosetta]EGD75376.1 hypothetical protein PTSG_06453 [Salpingoeca rosetta]|eukprot:XP_004991833.1 hypothetical protein PTSG_06453 [Salpingoeca rosetta]
MSDDLALPKAALDKLIKQHLGSVRASSDLKTAISACCTEMIHMLASQSNGIAEGKKRKIINPEDVIQALKELELEQYIPAAEASMAQVKEAAKVQRQRRANATAQKKAMGTEEMRREQEKMLAEARQAVQASFGNSAPAEKEEEQQAADDFSLDTGLFG